MSEKVDFSDVCDRLDLPSGDAIIVLDRLGKSGQYSREDMARNVLLITADARIVWRVRSQFDSEGNPFTRLHREGGKLTAYRWDGGSYEIDIDTGFATPSVLER